MFYKELSVLSTSYTMLKQIEKKKINWSAISHFSTIASFISDDHSTNNSVARFYLRKALERSPRSLSVMLILKLSKACQSAHVS